jgi:hypothetical protein
MKEKENLENNIKIFKKKRDQLEKKSSEMQQNFNKIDYELEKIRLQNDLLESNKNNFFNLNLMVNSNHYIPSDTNLKNINNLLSTVISINHENNKNLNNDIIHKNLILTEIQTQKDSSKIINSQIVENSSVINFTKPSSPLNQQHPINLTKIIPFSQLSPKPHTHKMTIEKFDHSISSMNGNIEKSNTTEKLSKEKNVTANMSKLSLSINHQHKDSKSTIINSKDSIESTLKEVSNSTANSTLVTNQVNSNVPLSKQGSNIVKINLNTLTKNNKREISQGKKAATPTLINHSSSIKTPTSLTISVNTQSKQNLHSNLLSPSANNKLDRRTSGAVSSKPRTASEDKFAQIIKQNSLGVRVSKVKENQVQEINPSSNTLNSSNAFNNANVSSFVKNQAPIVSSKYQKVTTGTKSMSVQKSLINVRKK